MAPTPQGPDGNSDGEVNAPKNSGFADAVREATSEVKAPKNPGFVEAVRKLNLLPERELERALGSDRNAFRLLKHLLASGQLDRREAIRVWAEGFGVTGIDIADAIVQFLEARATPGDTKTKGSG